MLTPLAHHWQEELAQGCCRQQSSARQEDPNDNYGGQISVKRDSTASLDKFGEQKKRQPVWVQDPAVPALTAQYPHRDFARLGTNIYIVT